MTATLTVRLARNALVGTARTLLSLRAIDLPPPGPGPRIYVANHVSHADFVALWSVLPDGVTWIGAGIIVASGLYLLRRERVHVEAEHP